MRRADGREDIGLECHRENSICMEACKLSAEPDGERWPRIVTSSLRGSEGEAAFLTTTIVKQVTFGRHGQKSSTLVGGGHRRRNKEKKLFQGFISENVTFLCNETPRDPS